MVTFAPSSTPLVALAVLAALCLLRWRRPGWSRRLARRLRPVATGAVVGAILLMAFALGLALDPLAPRGLARALSGQVFPALAPFGAWFAAPEFPRDLALLAILAAVVAADGRPRRVGHGPPGSTRAVRRPATAQMRAQMRSWAPAALTFAVPLLLLLLAWIDVLGSTLGVHAARLYERLAGAGWLAWHPAAGLAAEPDLRLLALYWWLAAGALALSARQRIDSRGALWPIVPLLGALLGVVARPLASALALPTFLGVAALASVLAGWPRARRTSPWCPSAIPERAALLGILGLALALRWTPLILGPPASDTFGYFETARTFYQRVADAGTNPIALAYLNLHPAAREPLFPLLLRAAFDVLGDSLVHQRYVTIALAVLGVYLTYRFGRACFGRLTGLLAALVVAVLPWQVMVSQEGLREELGMATVYGLAILVVTRPRSRTAPDATVHWPAAAAGGALAAGAVLTRLDAGAVVLALLLAWTLRHGRAWRATLPAWIVSGVLVVPLLAGYVLRAGDPLTPLGGNMGGDIQAAVAPLVRREQPPAEVLRAFAVGTYEVYGNTIYGNAAGWLPSPLRPAAVGLALVATAAGLAILIARGPRLPALLAVLGVFLPPFTYLAGISVTRGPGGGYTERYTYLILPATLAVGAWVVVRTVSWALAAAGSRSRRNRTIGAGPPPVVAAPDSA
jgi:hypothetical protein